jgi:hypothetical protein
MLNMNLLSPRQKKITLNGVQLFVTLTSPKSLDNESLTLFLKCRSYLLSNMSVTGPQLVNDTSIISPKAPVST